MTEITAKIDWPLLALAILLAPPLANAVLMVATLIYFPAAVVFLFMSIGSLLLGYVSYLMLAGPLMTLAHLIGANHPVIHAAIGWGAVWLIPAAHSAGLPGVADPEAVELGQWFGPVWCATAAGFYLFLRYEFSPAKEA